MKNSSFVEICEFVNEKGLRSVSFDIDGTIYPILKIQLRWWKAFIFSPLRAMRFYRIKKTWEGRRKGDRGVEANPEDVTFFEEFLTDMMDESLVPLEILDWIRELGACEVQVYFLSDHGAMAKLKRLGMAHMGKPINCLTETGELKPHVKISELLRDKYGIDPKTHLHLGDRWTDEEQAKLFGCEFRYFRPEELF